MATDDHALVENTIAVFWIQGVGFSLPSRDILKHGGHFLFSSLQCSWKKMTGLDGLGRRDPRESMYTDESPWAGQRKVHISVYVGGVDIENGHSINARYGYCLFDYFSRLAVDSHARLVVYALSAADVEALEELADYLALDRTNQKSILWTDYYSYDEDKSSTAALLPTLYVSDEGLKLECDLKVDFDIQCIGAKMLTVDSEWVEAVVAIHKMR